MKIKEILIILKKNTAFDIKIEPVYYLSLSSNNLSIFKLKNMEIQQENGIAVLI